MMYENLSLGAFIFWLLFGFVGLPLLTTIFNLYNLFFKKKVFKPFFELVTVLVGPFYSFIFYNAYFINKDVISGEPPLSDEYILTFDVFAVIALIGYLVYWIFRNKLNSVFTIFSIASMYIGLILSVAFIMQVIPNGDIVNSAFLIGNLIFLFPLNYILICISAFIQISRGHRLSSNDPEVLKITPVRFIIAIPCMAIIAAIVIAILDIFCSCPYDSIIKVFTETSKNFFFFDLY